MTQVLDDIDRQILTMLQENARVSNADIAREVGMVPSATLERLRKLEERGVVEGYETRLNPDAVQRGLAAYIFVRSNEPPGTQRAAQTLAEIDEVQEVHHVAGEDCFLIKVRAADTRDLMRLIRERIGSIPSVTSTRTTIVLDTVKETARIPLPGASS